MPGRGYHAAVIPLFSPAQVRALDERAIRGGTSSLALMERAAGHLARAIADLAGRSYGLRVTLLCGRGNNGGDGIAAGRRLLAMGAAPLVVLVGGEDALGADGVVQLRRYRAIGGRLVPTAAEALESADVAVDCLLGTGASGAPRPPYDDAVDALNAFAGPVIACDLPTGVDADTGAVPGRAVHADLTVTLGAHKRGLALWPARAYVGKELLGDLGLLTPADEPSAEVLEPADIANLVPPLPPEAHKRTRGVVVILAGSPGMAGAAIMVARGAMGAGAGLVTVATGDTSLVTATVPEAFTAKVPDDDPDRAFEVVASRVEDADALAVGPGLGHGEAASALVHRLVREIDLPLVLDADGINAFRDQGDALRDHASSLLTLTPHEREFARLLGAGGIQAWAARATVVGEMAKAWNAVVVAKGPGSIIGTPDGRLWINPTGSPALGTGGTGDVLTGMTTTLLAQRTDAESVAAGVYIHGLAGELAARNSATRSVSALDVAAAIPNALRAVGVG